MADATENLGGCDCGCTGICGHCGMVLLARRLLGTIRRDDRGLEMGRSGIAVCGFERCWVCRPIECFGQG